MIREPKIWISKKTGGPNPMIIVGGLMVVVPFILAALNVGLGEIFSLLMYMAGAIIGGLGVMLYVAERL